MFRFIFYFAFTLAIWCSIKDLSRKNRYQIRSCLIQDPEMNECLRFGICSLVLFVVICCRLKISSSTVWRWSPERIRPFAKNVSIKEINYELSSASIKIGIRVKLMLMKCSGMDWRSTWCYFKRNGVHAHRQDNIRFGLRPRLFISFQHDSTGRSVWKRLLQALHPLVNLNLQAQQQWSTTSAKITYQVPGVNGDFLEMMIQQEI